MGCSGDPGHENVTKTAGTRCPDQQEAGMTEGSETEAGTANAADDALAAENETPEEELKRKFREALDRKRQTQTDNTGGQGKGATKIHGTHGPAASRRSFRRKSGG